MSFIYRKWKLICNIKMQISTCLGTKIRGVKMERGNVWKWWIGLLWWWFHGCNTYLNTSNCTLYTCACHIYCMSPYLSEAVKPTDIKHSCKHFCVLDWIVSPNLICSSSNPDTKKKMLPYLERVFREVIKLWWGC